MQWHHIPFLQCKLHTSMHITDWLDTNKRRVILQGVSGRTWGRKENIKIYCIFLFKNSYNNTHIYEYMQMLPCEQFCVFKELVNFSGSFTIQNTLNEQTGRGVNLGSPYLSRIKNFNQKFLRVLYLWDEIGRTLLSWGDIPWVARK